MKRSTLALLATCLASTPTAAQNVITVGPGGLFTQIAPAVQAAQPGDIVQVQAGTYSSFGVDRGITVVALGSVFLTAPVHYPTIAVQSVPAGQRAVLAGPFLSFQPLQIRLSDCIGHVHVEGAGPSTLTIDRCTLATLRGVRTALLTITSSRVVVTQCQVPGTWVTASVDVTGSDVVLAESTVTSRASPFGPVPAVALNGGRLTVTGGADTVLTAGSAGAPMAAIAIQAGDLVLAPTVTLVPAAGGPPVSGGNVTLRDVPSLSAGLTSGTLSCRVHAAGAQFALTLLSTPRALPAATSIGTLWVEPWAILVDVAAIPGTGRHSFALPVPPLPPGVLVALQSFTVAAGGLGLSVPAVVELD